MSVTWWGLVGLFAAMLINRAADCWLSPARLQCGLTRHPRRQRLVLVGVPALYMLLAGLYPRSGSLWIMGVFSAILIALAVIDWEQGRVPNAIVLPATGLALVHAWQTGQLLSAAIGAALALVLFLFLHAVGRRFFGPGALGMGDVKLAGFIGAVIGLAWMPYALLLGVLLAGAAAAGLVLSGRARRGDSLPFGHFMALAAVIVLVAGGWAG